MSKCRVCKFNAVEQILDLGLQPVTSRFLKDPKELSREFKHPLILGVCKNCSLIQQMEVFQVESLIPRYDWQVRYSEPEDHLDDLCTSISKLLSIKNKAKVLGISFKDDTLLTRLEKKISAHVYRLDPLKDLDVAGSCGVETVQRKLTLKRVRYISISKGKFDVVVARHILEHVYDINGFLDSMKALLKPEGFVIFEVPGCDRAFSDHDYTTVWEEHILYFTRRTFLQTLASNSFIIVKNIEVTYPLENSLIVIAKTGNTKKLQRNKINSIKNNDIDLSQSFGNFFKQKKEKLNKFLSTQNPVVFFGAGHLASSFINYFHISDYIRCVIDDEPHKNGLYMAGSGVPIYSCDKLMNTENQLYFLSLNPRNEEIIINKNKRLFKDKRNLLSIFPSSRYALTI